MSSWDKRRQAAADEMNAAIERARRRLFAGRKAWNTRREREREESRFEEGAEWIVEEPFDEFGGEKYRRSHIMFQPEDLDIQKPKEKPKPVKLIEPQPFEYTFKFLNEISKATYRRALTSLLHSEVKTLAKYIVVEFERPRG